MELIKVGEKTYYISNAVNIGIYKVNEKEVYVIDTGNDKDSGKKILKIIQQQGWIIKGIISTHSHADHIGGNKILQEKTNCIILSNKIDKVFIENTILEPSFLYGGYPFKCLKNKFLVAQESVTSDIKDNLPDGLSYFLLKGHCYDMIGIKTSDNVYFLADSLFGENTISKYHIFYIYNVQEYLNTLEFLKTLNGNLFVPSHCEATTNILPLIELNKKKIQEISNNIYEICKNNVTFEEILKSIFDKYHLEMNEIQYLLIGSTIKSYLSFLYDQNLICFEFKNNKMLWKQVD